MYTEYFAFTFKS